MRKAILAFHLFTVSLFAGDPGYFTDTAKGLYFRDLISREPIEIIPGTLVDCKETAHSQTYTYWDCKAQGAELRIQANGKTATFIFEKLSATEYQTNPTEPSTISYSFTGTYQETLPDGAVVDATAQLSLSRYGAAPNSLRGQIYVSAAQFGFSMSGALAAQIPTPPAIP